MAQRLDVKDDSSHKSLFKISIFFGKFRSISGDYIAYPDRTLLLNYHPPLTLKINFFQQNACKWNEHIRKRGSKFKNNVHLNMK